MVKRIVFEEIAHIHEIEEPISDDLRKICRKGLNQINSNMRYVFNGYEHILLEYLAKHNPGLAELFISCALGEKPYYFDQDRSVKEILLKKFHRNPDYRIFDIDSGFIRLRRMINKDAVNIMKNLVSDIGKFYGYDKVEELVERVKKIEKNLQEVRKEYGILQNFLIDSGSDVTASGMIQKMERMQEMKELKEKIYGRASLY